jgi:hypothetical protein
MYTKEGPKIIEMGTRVQGEINPVTCLSYQQVDKALDSYLDTSHFNAYYNKCLTEDFRSRRFYISKEF